MPQPIPPVGGTPVPGQPPVTPPRKRPVPTTGYPGHAGQSGQPTVVSNTPRTGGGSPLFGLAPTPALLQQLATASGPKAKAMLGLPPYATDEDVQALVAALKQQEALRKKYTRLERVRTQLGLPPNTTIPKIEKAQVVFASQQQAEKLKPDHIVDATG